jgi:5-methylcytosine-specific restriction endonuclease McrA
LHLTWAFDKMCGPSQGVTSTRLDHYIIEPLERGTIMPLDASGFLAPQQATCLHCCEVFDPPDKHHTFYCSRDCKFEWLNQKYIVEGLHTGDLAKILSRDPKTVWTWLKDVGIPTRPPGAYSVNWCKKGEPSLFLGKKHTKEYKQRMSQLRKEQGRIPYDPKVGPPFKGKRGAEVPSWKGGVTPERQAFYNTPEWKECVKAIWKRDNATCQRCFKRYNHVGRRFEIHHIVSFQCRELRAVVSNLVMLCAQCHDWVHSRDNVYKDFIKEIPCS